MRGSKSILLLELPRQLLQMQSSNNNGTSVRPCECARLCMCVSVCMCESVCGCKLIVNTDALSCYTCLQFAKHSKVCNEKCFTLANFPHNQFSFHTQLLRLFYNCTALLQGILS